MFNAAYSSTYRTSFNGAYTRNYVSYFNGGYSAVNYGSAINVSFYSYGSQILVLSDFTKEINKFLCIVDGVEYPIEQFYIFRRKGFQTTITAQFGGDYWDQLKDKAGTEVSIFWQSPSFTGEMANSIVQSVSYRQDSHRRIVKISSFRAIKEVAQRKFIISDVEELTFNKDGVLETIKTVPQPAISPEDTITYKDIDYTVETVKITADTVKTSMVIRVYG